MGKFNVVITGADDGIDAIDIDSLGQEFPFVEFGILFSDKREGTARYPSLAWRESLYEVTFDRASCGYRLAAHLCGNTVDARLATIGFFETEIEKNFDGVQFNRFTGQNVSQILAYADRYKDHQIIVPFNRNTDTILTSESPEFWENISILCDSSGGKGIACKAWPTNIPKHFEHRQAVGYAGGINERNVEAVVDGLVQYHGDQFFWIDLETGARDEKDRFDIEKVYRILQLTEQYLDFDEMFGDLPGLDDEEDDDETYLELETVINKLNSGETAPDLSQIIIR